MAEKYVVAEHQRAGVAVDKRFADQERLREAVRARLHGVAEFETPLAAVAEQLLETRRVLRRRDQQDLGDTGEHQRGKRVIHHGLVVYRQQLLGYDSGYRVKPGT